MNENESLSIITRRLQPGETLVWYGAPSPMRAARQHLGMLAFMTIWTGLVVRSLPISLRAIQATDWKSVNPAVFLPVLFSLFGAAGWLWAAKKVVDCWRTACGLTNRWVIVAVGVDGPVKSYSAAALSGLVRTGDSYQGSILFDYGQRSRSYGYNAGLYGIRDPARVETLVYETLLGNKKGAAE